jgi:hypothetical protein
VNLSLTDWQTIVDVNMTAVLENGAMTSGSSMQAITRSLPPPFGQVSISMAKTRLRRCIHVMGARALWGASALGWRLGTMCSRCLQLGANTP